MNNQVQSAVAAMSDFCQGKLVAWNVIELCTSLVSHRVLVGYSFYCVLLFCLQNEMRFQDNFQIYSALS